MTEIAGVGGRPDVQVVDREDVGISGLEAADFLEMLIVQLQNQDPTEPTSNEEILSQVSQLRDLQSATDLSDTLQSLVTGSELSNAAGLIGQYIVGRNADGDLVEGVAGSARLVDGEAVLKINGQDVKLSAVESVSAAPAEDAA